MTGCATNALLNMNAVIEINKIRQSVHTIPDNWRIRAERITHGRKHRTLRPNLTMTIHANFYRRHSRKRRRFHRRVTVAAIDAVVADMMLVAKRHWLIDVDANAGRVRRAHKQPQHQQNRRADKHRAKNADPRNRIRTERITNGREHRTLRPDLAVTVHANLYGRHSSKRRSLNGRVAIAAIDSIVADVMLVTKRHRLIDVYANARRVCRAYEQPQHQ